MRHLASLAFLLGGAMLVGGAPSALAEPERPPGLVIVDPELTPDECHDFAAIPEDAREPLVFASQQALSFAACLLDNAAAARVGDTGGLAGMVEELTNNSAPAMMVYLVALEHAPPALQLRVAYQLGAANVAIMTRARASITAPSAKLATSARYVALRAKLEPLLDAAHRRAAASFLLVEHLAHDMPELAQDPVARYMIRNAKSLFVGLSPEAQVWARAEFRKDVDMEL
jgi:hypothetical protein